MKNAKSSNKNYIKAFVTSNFKMQIRHSFLINPTGACRAANSAEIRKAEKQKARAVAVLRH